MFFYRTTNSSIHAREPYSPKVVFAQPGLLIPKTSRVYYKTPLPSDIPACISNSLLSLLCTFYPAAAILPQPPPRHPSPRQSRLFVAENRPFSPFFRGCQDLLARCAYPCSTTRPSLRQPTVFTAPAFTRNSLLITRNCFCFELCAHFPLQCA